MNATPALRQADVPTLAHWIGGKRAPGASGRFGEVYTPATGALGCRVPFATAAEVARAVEVAKAAFPGWAATTPLSRARVMFRFKALLERTPTRSPPIIAREHGKVLSDAAGEVARGHRGRRVRVRRAAAPQERVQRAAWARASTRTRCASRSASSPGITPFNFPAMVPMWMFPMALVCGNAFVLKPSERDPSTALILAALLKEAGLPDGVFNVVNGDKEAVDALLAHPDVQAVSFVGSTPIAKYIYETGTAHGKRVQALGGAKNHAVVMPDADLDDGRRRADRRGLRLGRRALHGDLRGACSSATRSPTTCSAACGSKIAAMKVGRIGRPSAEMGPLVTAAHRDKVRGYVDSGVAEGAKLVVDGRGLKVPGHENGFFVGAGAVRPRRSRTCGSTRRRSSVRCCRSLRVADFDEALALVNAHEFGNGAAIFTRDGDAAREFVQRVQIGMVGVNVPIPVPVAFHSFGGWKSSLFGDHHIYGPESVRFYTRQKAVTQRWPSGIRAGAEFMMPTTK